jgi:hypothetical protein
MEALLLRKDKQDVNGIHITGHLIVLKRLTGKCWLGVLCGYKYFAFPILILTFKKYNVGILLIVKSC